MAPLLLMLLLPAMPAAEPGQDAALAGAIQYFRNPGVDPGDPQPDGAPTGSRLPCGAFAAAAAPARVDPGVAGSPGALLIYEDDAGFRRSIHDSLARMTHAYFLLGTVAHTANGAPLNSAELDFSSRHSRVPLRQGPPGAVWRVCSVALRLPGQQGLHRGGRFRGGQG